MRNELVVENKLGRSAKEMSYRNLLSHMDLTELIKIVEVRGLSLVMKSSKVGGIKTREEQMMFWWNQIAMYIYKKREREIERDWIRVKREVTVRGGRKSCAGGTQYWTDIK